MAILLIIESVYKTIHFLLKSFLFLCFYILDIIFKQKNVKIAKKVIGN